MNGSPPVAADAAPSPRSAPPNSDLLLAFLAPYAAYVGIATLAGGLSREVDYSIRIAVTAVLLIVLWKRYPPITGPRSPVASAAVGAAAGLLGVGLWIALVLPFQSPDAGVPFEAPAFALRLAAATLVVPLVEELLFRGYLLGLVTQWQEARRAGASDAFGVAFDRKSVHTLAPGAWTPLALVLSSVAFALGHAPAQWLAAFGYGLLMAALWVARRDLLAPIVAHAVTNFVLYLYIFYTGSWGLW